MPYRLVNRHRALEWVLLAPPSGQNAADGCTVPFLSAMLFLTLENVVDLHRVGGVPL